MKNILKTVILLVCVTVFFGGLYYMLSREGVFDGGMSTAEDVRAETDKLETEILTDLWRINAITLDVQVFTMPEYRGLVEPIVPPEPTLPISRPNPFARY